MLDDAAARGWHIMTFYAGGGGGSLPIEDDPHGVISYAARIQDTMNALPQAHGIVQDGPGEQHYELAFHHGGELLEIRPGSEERFTALGFDLGRLQRGIDHLRTSLQGLTPAAVRYQAAAGTLAGMQLFDINEDVIYWLRARRAAGARLHEGAIAEQMPKLNRKVELGGIPRTAAFSSLTCQDYVEMGRLFDYVFPKHYYWHRGFDGLYGTVARWVQRLLDWNPTLSEADGLAVVRALFGIELPGVHSLLDMEMGFPDEFFSQVVYGETQRAADAIGPDKTICWVSTGRAPHAGDAMTARDLYTADTGRLAPGQSQALSLSSRPRTRRSRRHILTNMCGTPWKEDMDGSYWPADTPRSTFSGHREPERYR